jgi:hypothetical protein
VGLPASLLAPGRDPSFLFIYAPTSFGWHDLLMQGASVDPASLYFYNRVGAGLVGFWLGVFFLLILGFSYSYFWSASTIIYLLMRKKVDDADLDEVYLEEEDQEEGFAPTPARATAPPPAPTPAYTTAGASQMVDAPTLRTPSAPPPPPSPPPPTPPPPKQEETGSAATNNPPATRSEPPRPDEEKADKKSDEAK